MSATPDKTIAELERTIAELRRERDESLVQRTSDYADRAAHQAATIGVLKATSASPGDPQPVFDLIIERARDLCDAYGVSLWEFDGTLIHLRASNGISDDPAVKRAIEAIYPMPPSRERSIGHAILDRQIIRIDDYDTDPRLGPEQRGLTVKSGIIIPFMRGGEAIGGIGVGRRERGGFSESQEELIQTFAEQAVIAITSAETWRALRDRTGELTERDAENRALIARQGASIEVLRAISTSPDNAQPVLDLIVRHARTLCNAQAVNLLEYDGTLLHQRALDGFENDPEARARLLAGFPRPPGPETGPGRVFMTGQMVHVPYSAYETGAFQPGRRHGVRAFLGVPLLREGRTIGVLGLARFDPGDFDQSAIELVRSFAEQAVIALSSAAALRELRERTGDLQESLEYQTATSDVLKVISRSTFDLQPVLDTVAETAARLCDAEQAVIFRFDGRSFRLAANFGFPPEYEAYQHTRGPIVLSGEDPTATGRAILERRPIHIHDAAAVPGYPEVSIKVGKQRTSLGVPLLREGEAIGVIVMARQRVEPFTDRQIELVSTFADQAVIAIENTRLLTEQREALEQQTATSEILEAINANQGDLKPVFDTMLENAMRLCESTFGEMHSFDGERFQALAIRGVPETYAEYRLRPQRSPHPLSAAGRLAAGEQVVHIADLRSDTAYQSPGGRALVDLGGARTALAIGLRKDGVLLGGLQIYRQEVRPYSDKQIALLENFAAQAVIAMENARLLGELRERTEALAQRNSEYGERIEQQSATIDVLKAMSASPGDAQPVFDLIVQRALEFCDGQGASLALLDGEMLHVRALLGFSEAAAREFNARFPQPVSSATLFGRAILARDVVQSRDTLADMDYGLRPLLETTPLRSIMGVPISRDSQPIGAITLGRYAVGGFTPIQMELLQTFAEQAAIAIRSVETYHALQARTADLQESLEYQTATSDVLKVISRSTFDLQPVLDTVVQTAAHLCDADQAVIFRREGAFARLSANFGFPAEYEAYHKGLGPSPMTPRNITAPMRALMEGRIVHIPDAAAVPGYLPEAVGLGKQRTALGVPLQREGETIGSILLARQRVEPFTQRQIELVSTFADQAVIAIENTRLLTEQREALERQTATAEVLQVINESPGNLVPVFDTMLEKAMRLCGAAFGILRRYEAEQLHTLATLGVPEAYAAYMAKHVTVPAPGTSIAKALETGQPSQVLNMLDGSGYNNGQPGALAITDLGGARTVLHVPLVKDGISIGLFTLYRQEVRAFTDKQFTLLENFAAQAVIAMENARLLTEQQEALEQQTATAEVLQVINASPGDLSPVFDSMLEKAMRLCDALSGGLFTYDGDRFHTAAILGVPPALAEFRAKNPPIVSSGGSPARMLATRRPDQILDLMAEERYREGNPHVRAMVELGGARTLLNVPLLKDGNLAGFISVYREEVRAFSRKQIALLENFAAQAVIAMENARLINEQREALEQQTATAEVLQVINASPGNLTPVFETILLKAHKLCDVAVGSLVTYDGELMHVQVTHGLPPDVAGMVRPPFQPNPNHQALVDGARFVHIPDLKEDAASLGHELTRSSIVSADIHTSLYLPLRKDRTLLGFISAFRREIRPFSEKEIALLENFAAQAVIAMENARLLDELRKRTEALALRNNEFGERIEQQAATIDVLKVMSSTPDDTQPVFDQIVRRAQELCNGLGASLFEFDGKLVYFRAAHSPAPNIPADPAAKEAFMASREAYRALFPMVPTHSSLSCRAILEKQVVHIRDLRADPGISDIVRDANSDILSHLTIPLMRDGQAIGSISLRGKEPGGFTDSQVALLQTFAEQAVIAIGSVANFRALRQRTAELAQRQAELRVTFENMGDGVAMFDETQHLAAWNRKFQDLLDVPDAIIARRQTFSDYVRYLAERGEYGPGADPDEQIRRLTERAGEYRAYERTRPDGRVIEIRHNPVPGGGFVLIYADITERKRNEAEIAAARDAAQEATRTIETAFRELKTAQANLVQAEKMASLGQLTAGIAHEIKNPLNFVNNFAELSVDLLAELKEALAPAEAALSTNQRDEVDDVVATLTGNLRRIAEHGKRADGIVKSMLEHSRGASGERRTVDINALADEALNLAYHGARAQDQSFNIALEREFDGHIAPIEVNPQDLTRVFLNLFSNGFYAANKRAKNGADRNFRPTLKLTTRDVGDVVEIRVRDNGTGVPAEIREQLFQPFFTTKPTGEGTGLGLSITYDIVTKAHGGTIAVNSVVDDFTEFVVTLPRGMFTNEHVTA